MTHPDTLIPRAVVEQALEGFDRIRRYGLDTLSGRTDGPDDRDWQRNAVNEMTKRARLSEEALRAALQPQAAAEPVKFPRDGILGVRVQDDTVIIKMKGGKRWGNQRARELCHKLLTDREHEPGGNPNAFNKWS